jgi:retron-type reverse transcriptase
VFGCIAPRLRLGRFAFGVLANGVVIERHEGAPQGGPVSPLLVDKELERRGHAFVRYVVAQLGDGAPHRAADTLFRKLGVPQPTD